MHTKSRNTSKLDIVKSVQQMSTSRPAVFHWVAATLVLLSSVNNVGKLPLTNSCLNLSLSFSHDLSLLTTIAALRCLFPSAFQGKVSIDPFHTKKVFLVCSQIYVSQLVPINHFVNSSVSVAGTHESSANLSVTPAKIVTGLKLFRTTKLSYLIVRRTRSAALKRVHETACPASCIILCTSCPLMEKNVQLIRFLGLQSSQLCHQIHNCRRLHSL